MVPRIRETCPIAGKTGLFKVKRACRKLIGCFLALTFCTVAGPVAFGLDSDPFADQFFVETDTQVSPGNFELAAKTRLRKRKRKRISDPSISGSGSRRVYGRQSFKWFWSEVSPSKTAASSARWAAVLKVIEQGRRKGKAVFGSRGTAERIVQNYGEYLQREAKRRNVSVPFLIAVIAVESNGNATAKSPVGARGLMQLMPPTAARFGVSNSYAPSQNIRGGAHYLDWLLRRFRNDAVLALAGYNAGEGAVDKHRGVPPYSETRDYVAKVAGAFSAARMLCKKPPSSPREPCELR